MIVEQANQREAYIEGAKNLYRFNRSDLFNVVVYVGAILVLFAACWLLAHGLLLLPHAQPQPVHYGPVPTDPSFPRFKG